MRGGGGLDAKHDMPVHRENDGKGGLCDQNPRLDGYCGSGVEFQNIFLRAETSALVIRASLSQYQSPISNLGWDEYRVLQTNALPCLSDLVLRQDLEARRLLTLGKSNHEPIGDHLRGQIGAHRNETAREDVLQLEVVSIFHILLVRSRLLLVQEDVCFNGRAS